MQNLSNLLKYIEPVSNRIVKIRKIAAKSSRYSGNDSTFSGMRPDWQEQLIFYQRRTNDVNQGPTSTSRHD